MSETGRRLYVERQGGIRNSCPLYTTIGEASGRGGALPIEIGGVRCYAPLCSVGASESIGAYVERLGGVRMAIANTGSRPYTPPPTPPTPPTPPKPTWTPLGVTTLRINPWGASSPVLIGNTPGKKIITSEGDYIWTANFRPSIPINTTAIRVDTFGNDIYNVRFQSGGSDCEIPAAYRGRVRSLSAYAGNTIAHDQAGAHISMRDEEGAYLGILGVVVFKMNKNPLVDYGYRYTRVLFSVTCLG